MKKILNRLTLTNGWQRIYLLVAILILPLFFIYCDEPTLKSDIEIDSNKEIYAEKMAKILKTKTSRLPESQHYKMTDGTEFQSFHTKEEVENTYEEIKKSLQREDSIELYIFYLKQFLLYIITVVLIYFFGWFISWIIKGFKSDLPN
jgi:hypothetical protein